MPAGIPPSLRALASAKAFLTQANTARARIERFPKRLASFDRMIGFLSTLLRPAEREFEEFKISRSPAPAFRAVVLAGGPDGVRGATDFSFQNEVFPMINKTEVDIRGVGRFYRYQYPTLPGASEMVVYERAPAFPTNKAPLARHVPEMAAAFVIGLVSAVVTAICL